MLLGQRIKRLRATLGLTQVAFAELLAVSQGTVSRWEQGFQTPEAEQLAKLSEISGDDLLSFGPFAEAAKSDEGGTIIVTAQVIGGLRSGYWSPSDVWSPARQFSMEVPIPRRWHGHSVYGFAIEDDGWGDRYPCGTLVFAVLTSEILAFGYVSEKNFVKLQPRAGDVVLTCRRLKNGERELSLRSCVSIADHDEMYFISPSYYYISVFSIPESLVNSREFTVVGLVVSSFRQEARTDRLPKP